MLRELLKKIIRPNLRLWLKRRKRRMITFFNRDRKVALIDVKKLLVEDFKLKKGDNIIVTSSFGNLNAEFSPEELIDLMQNIVGEIGNIVMPYYPGNSFELAKNNVIFNMKSTTSAMGILTQVFSERDNVYKSMHPTKSVVVWGNDAKRIIKNHENARTPFGFDTPYGWLYKNGSKSIGLGVKSAPMFHFCEDILYLDKLSLYLKPKLMTIVDYDGNIINVETKVHNPKVFNSLMEIGDYLNLNNPKSYMRKKIGYNFSYIMDNRELYDFCKIEFENENFRYKK